MFNNISDLPRGGSGNFQRIAHSFLSREGLPFSDVLSSERIEQKLRTHNGLFGGNGIYTTAIVVWSFLSQVLRDGKEASCQAAVARVVSHCHMLDLACPTEDTGDYCRARGKLSITALHELSNEVAEEMEQAADPSWLWKGKHHAHLIDGFTFTLPDTEKNQAEYPQPKGQKKGVGLPIARAVAILSLATACLKNLAFGAYQGKETGEPALLRGMLSSLASGDIAVMDRYYCSYMMLALLLAQGTQVCARKHQLRHSDFRRGKRLGKYDHLIVWTRPQRPSWMDEQTYQQIPETLVLRETRFHIIRPGRRTRTIDVITTLLDPNEYTKEDIAELYGFRWNSDLDIRSIKWNLNLDHLRCKSPEMVQREMWTTILGYNLIRTAAAAAALLHQRQPRQISFTSTCQYVLASWMQLADESFDESKLERFLRFTLKQIANCQVANRPGRLEPRVIKRRRHRYKLMQQPRAVLRAQLRNECT